MEDRNHIGYRELRAPMGEVSQPEYTVLQAAMRRTDEKRIPTKAKKGEKAAPRGHGSQHLVCSAWGAMWHSENYSGITKFLL
jgi:hypothetical protein